VWRWFVWLQADFDSQSVGFQVRYYVISKFTGWQSFCTVELLVVQLVESCTYGFCALKGTYKPYKASKSSQKMQNTKMIIIDRCINS
jgi:hypothetical protein